MTTRNSIRKMFSMTALFAALSVGVAVLAKADSVLVQNVDGQAVCGVRTHMSRGGKLGLMIADGEVDWLRMIQSGSLTARAACRTL